jgi:hypothetical protein
MSHHDLRETPLFRPGHGPLSPDYRLCKTTVMDTSDPGLRFDGNGECHLVRFYRDREAAEVKRGEVGAKAFRDLARRVRRRNGFNCICGVSGGVDSSLVLLRAVEAGFRPLAVHVDNGWNEELAVANIERLTSSLNVPLHTEVLDWEEFRDIQRSFFLASVPNVEMVTDHALLAALFRTARRMGAPCILSGSNHATEAFLPTNASYQNKDWIHIRALHRRFGSLPIRTFPHLSKASFAWSVLARGIRFVPVLNWLDYQREAAKQELSARCGWRDYGRKHGESKFTRFFQEHYLPVKFGIDKRRAHLSCQVLAGEISRADALAELERPMWGHGELRQTEDFVRRKLGFSDEDWRQIMSAPPRSHLDYPTDPFFRNNDTWGFGVLRRLATGRTA